MDGWLPKYWTADSVIIGQLIALVLCFYNVKSLRQTFSFRCNIILLVGSHAIGKIKMNIVAVLTHHEKKSDVYTVARNHWGKIMAVNYRLSNSSSALEAGRSAASLGVGMAKALKEALKVDCIFETTSLTLRRFIEDQKLRLSLQ